MKKLFLIITSCFLILQVNGQKQRDSIDNGAYTNPIFSGDYPDPSILVDGKDYYIVHSSFEYYPGLLIWHSYDLINWTPVTTALNKYVGSVWAPDLIKYNGRYYIYFPASGTNYVVYADNIAGPWSDPVELKITLIDPGHVVDDKGNRYLYFSSGAYVPLSKDGLSIAGEIIRNYSGWEIPRDWQIECFCMEGPKLFKRGEYYYLTVAEGGTSGPPTGHMVISARSKSPLDPWENSPFNPVIRTKDASEKWESVGHGTIFEDTKGDWQMIFHGYEKGHYNMGRQTLMVPIEWTEDGWYKVPENIKIAEPIKLPLAENRGISSFSLCDSFDGKTLKPQWRFFEEYDKDRFIVKDNSIVINGKGKSVADCSPMLTMPSDHAYTAQVEMKISGDATGGLVLFYNKQAFSGILADTANILTDLRGWQFVSEKDKINNHVFLRLKSVNNIVNMYYSTDGNNWVKSQTSLEMSAYHHNVLGGFMSLRIGLCSIGDGAVQFKNFKYEPIK